MSRVTSQHDVHAPTSRRREDRSTLPREPQNFTRTAKGRLLHPTHHSIRDPGRYNFRLQREGGNTVHGGTWNIWELETSNTRLLGTWTRTRTWTSMLQVRASSRIRDPGSHQDHRCHQCNGRMTARTFAVQCRQFYLGKICFLVLKETWKHEPYIQLKSLRLTQGLIIISHTTLECTIINNEVISWKYSVRYLIYNKYLFIMNYLWLYIYSKWEYKIKVWSLNKILLKSFHRHNMKSSHVLSLTCIMLLVVLFINK